MPEYIPVVKDADRISIDIDWDNATVLIKANDRPVLHITTPRAMQLTELGTATFRVTGINATERTIETEQTA